jgi:flagellar FliJ protein
MHKFELEKVLDVRRHIEDALKSELGTMEQAIKKEKEVISRFLGKKDKLARSIEKKLAGGASSAEYLLYTGFINKINQDIDAKNALVVEAQRKRDDTREELMNAVKNRKALEKLKEKRAAEYHAREKRIEMNQLDDFSSNAHIRRMEVR